MLDELHVENLGVIADLTLEVGRGLTAVTGETGAGKTLLVDALTTALGGRVSASMVRAGADEALVEARFTSSGHPEDHPHAGDELVLARSVPASGRSRAWIDGRMATVAALAERGVELVDIHGQHERHSLLGPLGQRRALDGFANVDPGPLQEARRRLSVLDRGIAELGGSASERARTLDLLRYQVDEIDRVGIDDPEEDEQLRLEAERLGEASAYREAAEAARLALTGADDAGGGEVVGAGVASGLGRAMSRLGDRAAFGTWRGRLEAVAREVEDVAEELRAVAEQWEEDPERLANVQERRRLLGDLRRKHGPSLGDVLATGERLRSELAELEGAEELLAGLEAQRDQASRQLEGIEQQMLAQRRKAGAELAAEVTPRLQGLAMGGARLEVEVSGPGGDQVKLYLAANPGEPARPLAEVASGGELARATLALRLSAQGGPETLLFDEVDAGVGGTAALALADALATLAQGHQVLVVTHLPQVAAAADRQLVVSKTVVDGRTVTGAQPVEGAARRREIARMLSGHPDSQTALAHAEDLLKARSAGSTGSSPAGR